MGTAQRRHTTQTNGYLIPVILFLSMIIVGVLLSLFADPSNDLQRYSFIVIISLGAGLGATYLTGQITGGGKFGFINIKSATGGFCVFLITLATFLFFFPKSIASDSEKVQKYFNLATLSEFKINASFIDKSDNQIAIQPNELYSILNNVEVQRTSTQTTLVINFSFTKEQLQNKKFFFSFDEAFRKYIAPALHEADGWSSPATNLYTPDKFKKEIDFKIKLN